MNRYSEKRGKELFDIVRNFIEEQKITCPETIVQSDRVVENAYDLIEELCDVVGYHKYSD